MPFGNYFFGSFSPKFLISRSTISKSFGGIGMDEVECEKYSHISKISSNLTINSLYSLFQDLHKIFPESLTVISLNTIS